MYLRPSRRKQWLHILVPCPVKLSLDNRELPRRESYDCRNEATVAKESNPGSLFNVPGEMRNGGEGEIRTLLAQEIPIDDGKTYLNRVNGTKLPKAPKPRFAINDGKSATWDLARCLRKAEENHASIFNISL